MSIATSVARKAAQKEANANQSAEQRDYLGFLGIGAVLVLLIGYASLLHAQRPPPA